MNNEQLVKFLTDNNACKSGISWAKTQGDALSTWQACHRGDWLLWFARKCHVNKRKVVLSTCRCVVDLMENAVQNESRPLETIKKTEAWCFGDSTIISIKDAAIGCAKLASDHSANALHYSVFSVAHYVASSATEPDLAIRAIEASSMVAECPELFLRESADIIRSEILFTELDARN